MKKQITRSCSGCTVCCTMTERPAITPDGKTYECGDACPKICAKGCSSYSRRPEYCREFKCAYARTPIDSVNCSDDDRPDKCGVLIWFVPYFGAGFRVVVDTSKLTDRGRRLIEEFKPMTYLYKEL
jgi:hypothetical protein